MLSWMKPAFLATILYVCAGSAAAAVPPNVVLLIIDDLGYGELPAHQAATAIPTPHLDAIASSGVRFTDGYVTAPFCAASRAALLTGRYQTRFGFEFNPIGPQNEEPGIGLPVTEDTLADVLREESGHATALIGKWHLGGTAPFHPQRRGFDEFFGFLHEGHSYVATPYKGVMTWLRRETLPGGGRGRWTSADRRLVLTTELGTHEPDYDADNPIQRASQPVAEAAHLTDAFTREAVDFIGRNAERPFFLCVAWNAVHSPMQAADSYLARFAGIEDIHRRIFAAMLAHLDDGIGQITTKLHEAGLDEKTLVIVISDNGGPTRELTSSNLPLRGEKGSLLEGGIRVPFLMRWPGMIPSGQVYSEPVSSLDIFATITNSGTKPLDGVNLLPYLTGQRQGPPHEDLWWRVGQQAALRSGPWKLLRGRTGDWELYRLDQDPGEAKDLAATEPAKLRELSARWDLRNAEMVPPLWR